MLYDVYFHNDFDGRAAAAVMLSFLRSRGDDIEHFTPLDYYLFDDYLKENFFTAHKLFKGKRNPAIVVDFPFHPKAAWWFDHHGAPCRKKSWLKKFKQTEQWHHDPQYASCCKQVAEVLKKQFGWKPPKFFEETIRWGDILDGAKYASARQTIELKEPALQVAVFFDRRGDDPITWKTFTELLAEQPLVTIARRADVRALVRKAKKEIIAATAYVRKNLLVYDRVGYIFLPSWAFSKPRFIPFVLRPEMLFLVRVFKKEALWHLSAGQNPWRKVRDAVDIGKLLGRYGGGGHHGVGAVEFKTRKEAERAASEIVVSLNERAQFRSHAAKK
jgi:hypothetical protein